MEGDVMRLSIPLVFLAILLLASVPAIANPIRSFSDLPVPNVNLLSFGGFDSFRRFLANNGIDWFTMNMSGSWTKEGDSGFSGFLSSNTTDSVTPYGSFWVDSARKLVFSTPVYSIGATFLATQNPPIDNPADSFDNNLLSLFSALKPA